MNRRPALLFLVVVLMALAACRADAPVPTATPRIVPSNTPAPTATAVATATPASSAAATTSAPPATATSLPTATATPTPIPAQPVERISLVPVVESGLTRPLYLTHAYDERLFVVEQAGLIRIIADGALQAQPFLDIQERVQDRQNEQGLLSVAFHPQYQTNGRFFVNYTNADGHTHVSEFRVRADDPNLGDPASETILLTVEQPYGNHNGGLLKFGPDGYLYVGLGDGGSANDPLEHGQNPNTLLGTLLRLDVDFEDGRYAIPADNPFIDDDTQRNEIWAWGLRNPWRFTFDRVTGDLFISDVGQNIWEEVSFQPADSRGGENYGWKIMEGNHCFQSDACDTEGLVLPIFEYDHSFGCSVTGGYVYRGAQFPSLTGNYFVADYCQGRFWRLFPTPEGDWSSAEVLDTNLVVSSFGEDANGELYVLGHANGSVWQIQP